ETAPAAAVSPYPLKSHGSIQDQSIGPGGKSTVKGPRPRPAAQGVRGPGRAQCARGACGRPRRCRSGDGSWPECGGRGRLVGLAVLGSTQEPLFLLANDTVKFSILVAYRRFFSTPPSRMACSGTTIPIGPTGSQDIPDHD